MPRKQRRRANGEGSVFQRSDGYWIATITVTTLQGKAKRIVRGAPSQRAALMKLDELRAEFKSLQDNPEAVTVRELSDRWMQNTEGQQSTIDNYRNILDKHLLPVLGDRFIASLGPLDVQEWLQGLRDKETGARTVQLSYAMLNRVCEWAVQIRMLDHNPCKGIKRPSAKRESIRPFTREDVAAILKATKADRLHALFVLAFTTGMRQGELFGLQWKDLDETRGLLKISRQARDYRGKVELKAPKTEAGVRTISLAKTALAALSARRILAEKEGHGSEQIFTSPKGMLIRRTLFGRRIWKPLLEKLNIDHRGAHHMRHTAATTMLGAGVPPHIVAGVLGHETAETVMRVYAHYITKDSSIAAEAMDRAFPAATM
jgi:integrase